MSLKTIKELLHTLGKVSLIKSGHLLPVEELSESTARYLVSAENGLKLAAVVNLAHLSFCFAFFT